MSTILRWSCVALVVAGLGCGDRAQVVDKPSQKPQDDGFEALLAEAVDAWDSSRYPKAVRLLEEALAKRPDSKIALRHYMHSLHRQALELDQNIKTKEGLKLCEKAVAAHERLRKLHEGAELEKFDSEEKKFLADLFYDEGCFSAISGDAARGMKCLQRAYDAGFTDVEHIEEDDDLATLRGLPEYKEFLKKAKAEQSRGPGSK